MKHQMRNVTHAASERLKRSRRGRAAGYRPVLRAIVAVVVTIGLVCFSSSSWAQRGGGSGGGSGGPAGGGAGGVGGPGGGVGGGVGGPGSGPAGGGAGGMGAPGGGVGGGMAGRVGAPRQQAVELAVKMYNVGDLIANSQQLPQSNLPGLGGGLGGATISAPGGGQRGGLGGMGGGAGGGGLFAIASPRGPLQGPGLGGMGAGGPGMGGMGPRGNSELYELIETIESTVDPESWDNRGSGSATISSFKEVLIISQTAENHANIETLLTMLRKSIKAHPTVTVKAIWLSLNETEFRSLNIKPNQQVDANVLAELVKTNGQRAQLTCFDKQAASLTAGNLKSFIESMIPVVGQNELPGLEGDNATMLAKFKQPAVTPRFVFLGPNSDSELELMRQLLAAPQRASATQVSFIKNPIGKTVAAPADVQDRNVGYQPVMRWVNYGAVLNVLPNVDEGGRRLTLSVSSQLATVESGEGLDHQGIDPQVLRLGGVALAQPSLRVQQFQSNMRLESGVPTLVGGSAFQSDTKEQQTYLVVEAIVNEH